MDHKSQLRTGHQFEIGSLEGRSVHEPEDKSHICGSENITQKSDLISVSEGGPFSGVSLVGRMEMLIYGVCRSIKTVIFSNKLNFLMPFGPLAIVVHLLTDNQVKNGCIFSTFCYGIYFM
ncbi:hypothetical protein SAY86_016031 [Trapa natans]|uniref:Uncharacterized protein n=1 Tax=Trapa natans TaxID=22666 RepID=A0AAN7LCA4_TRANT|nr:hypothetical protein SAY86_016031 [Trapa natans]